jgi:hypothetical protein
MKMKTGFLVRILCAWLVIWLIMVCSCTEKKTTEPTEPELPAFFLIEEYFPLNYGDSWIWEMVAYPVQEEYVDGDSNMGEPFVDQNGNGHYDYDEQFDDVNFNGKYDGPFDPWAPGMWYKDRNSNGLYDAPNEMWEEREFFLDLDGNGVCNLARILTLDAAVTSLQDSLRIRSGRFPGTYSDETPGEMWGDRDIYSIDSLGLRWHGHVVPITIARCTVEVGDSVVSARNYYPLVRSWTSTLVGVEDITVPAGTFERCLKFESYAWGGWYTNMRRYSGTSYQWFAKHVGMVKSEGPEQGDYWILKSALVCGEDYP